MDIGYSPLFLLGLVAGFNFIKEWEATRYRLAREDGHKLYFRAAFWGLVVCLVTSLFFFGLLHLLPNSWRGPFNYLTDDTASFVIQVLLTSPFFAFLIAKLFNKFTNEYKYYLDALRENEFEWLLVNAMETNFMVMITLEDGKVYVGWVYRVSDPAKSPRKYFSIIPVVTGFRDEKQKVCFTTFYDQLYESMNKSLSHLDTEHFMTVLPAHHLASCRLFDPDAYAEFQGIFDNSTVEAEQATLRN